jgi:type II secretory pathway pseudopilin PulG
MNVGDKHRGGYTIVETLIFLAISSVLLVSALIAVGGQQGKTQFSQSLRDLQSRIDDTINDVATGYYYKNKDFSCTADELGGAPVPTAVNTDPTADNNEQGGNAGCIFLGRVIQFAPSGAADKMKIMTVVGRQYEKEPLGKPVFTYTQAKPVVLLSPLPDLSEDIVLQYGLTIRKMTYRFVGSDQDVAAVGLFAGLAQYSSGGSASQSTAIVPIITTSLGDSPSQVATAISASGTLSLVDVPITMCFESPSTKQYGIISIGSNQGRLTTSLEILNATPTPSKC